MDDCVISIGSLQLGAVFKETPGCFSPPVVAA